MNERNHLLHLRLRRLRVVGHAVECDDDGIHLVGVSLGHGLWVRVAGHLEEHLVRSHPLKELPCKPEHVADVIQKLPDVELLAATAGRVLKVESHGAVGLIPLALLDLQRAGVERRHGAECYFPESAVGDARPRSPIARRASCRVHERWQGGHARPVDPAVHLGLDLHLRAAKSVGKRARLIHPLLAVGEAGKDERIVVVAVEKLVVRVFLGVRVEHGAENPLTPIVLVDQALVAVNHHDQVALVGDVAAVALLLLTVELVAVLAAQVGDGVFHPIGIPPFGSHLLFKLLRGVERAPENVRAALRIGDVGRQNDFSVRGARMDDRAIHAQARHRDRSLPTVTEVA